MRATEKKAIRFLTAAVLGSALVLPMLSPLAATADEGMEPQPYAMNESVIDTFKSETCQSTSSHYWEGNYTYRTITFHTSFAWDHRDIISNEVKYPCHYQTNHMAAHTKWKNYYRTW